MPRRPVISATSACLFLRLSSAVLLAMLLAGCATGNSSPSVRPASGPDAACWVGEGSDDAVVAPLGGGQIGIVDTTPRLWSPRSDKPEAYRAADLPFTGRVIAAGRGHGRSHVITVEPSDDGQRILAYTSAAADQGFSEPATVRTVKGQLLDVHLQILDNGRLLLLVAERQADGGSVIHTVLSSVPERWAYRGKSYEGDDLADHPTSFELPTGELLIAYRRTGADGSSSIVQRRSADGGTTWSSATILWPMASGLQPAGYLPADDGLSFIAGIDSDSAADASAGAGVEVARRLSTDSGVNWQQPQTLLATTDLKLHGLATVSDDRAALLASRTGSGKQPRTYYLYEIEVADPSVGLSCRGDRRPILFRDGFETGDTSKWPIAEQD